MASAGIIWLARLRIAAVLGNYSPYPSTKEDGRLGEWRAGNNDELAYVPTSAPFLKCIEPLRRSTLL